MILALISAASFTTLTALAEPPAGTTHGTVTPVGGASNPARPVQRVDRMTKAYSLVGRGTASRLQAVASEKRGNNGSAAKQHATAARYYARAARHFQAAGSPEAKQYAKHAVNEYKQAGDPQRAARVQPLASQPSTATPTMTPKTSSTNAPASASKASLVRLTAASRATGDGTAARLRADALAAKGLRAQAAAEHEEAASSYDLAAGHYRAAGALQYFEAYVRFADQERAVAAKLRAGTP
jgi:hypothetical protein